MSASENNPVARMPKMQDQIDRVATLWLPANLRKNIEASEQKNFSNLVEAVEEVASSIPDATAACAKQNVLLDADPLLDHITTYELFVL